MAVAAPPSAMANTPPNQSVYIQNLNEKLQKDDLRRALYMLFSTYGPVLDVTALKTKKMRGQAHVLFRDVNAANQAMRACQDLEFFGRKLSISFSKNRSQALDKLTGNFQGPNAAPAAQPKQLAQPPSSFPPPPGSFPAPPGTAAAQPNKLPVAPPSGLPPPPGMSQQPNGTAALQPPKVQAQDAPSPQGTKRQREDSEDEEAPMDEDDDEGEMDMSDDD